MASAGAFHAGIRENAVLKDFRKKYHYGWTFLKKGLVHLNLQILYQCNFKCRICDFWTDTYKDRPRLSVEQVRMAAEKLNPLGPQVVSIGGGEPLLHEDLIEISSIFSKDHFTVMITNGWFMTPEIARDLFEAGLYEVSVSLDYADPRKHDAMRGVKGAFHRAKNALEMLHANRVHPHQRVNMISTISDENLEETEALIHMSREMGITYLVSCYCPSRGDMGHGKAPKDYSKHLLALKKKYRHFVSPRGYLERFSEVRNGTGIFPCMAGKNLFNIDCQGNVTRCIDRLTDIAGNILTDDIDEISKNLLEQHRQNTCSSCWTSCRGPMETLMYGKQRLRNYRDYYQMTRDVPVGGDY